MPRNPQQDQDFESQAAPFGQLAVSDFAFDGDAQNELRPRQRKSVKLGLNPFPSPFLNLYHVDSVASSHSASTKRKGGPPALLAEPGRQRATVPSSSEPSRVRGFDFDDMSTWMETLLTHASSTGGGGESSGHMGRTRSVGSTSSESGAHQFFRRTHSAPSERKSSAVESQFADTPGSPTRSLVNSASRVNSLGKHAVVRLDLSDPSVDRGPSSNPFDSVAPVPESPRITDDSGKDLRTGTRREARGLPEDALGEHGDVVRSRWKKAMWFAIGEAQKRRKSEVYEKECTRIESGRSFVDSIVGAGAIVPEDVEAGASATSSWTKRLLDSPLFMVLFLGVTVYILLVPDLYWLLTASDQHDRVLLTINMAVACMLALEILLRLVGEAEYRRSVLLPVDVLATVSLLPQIAWLLARVDVLGGTDGLVAARAVRAGQLGARMIRMARLARLVLRIKLMHRRRGQHGEEEDVVQVVERSGVGLGLGESLQQSAFHILIAAVFALLAIKLVSEILLAPDSANHALAKLSLCMVWRSAQLHAATGARRVRGGLPWEQGARGGGEAAGAEGAEWRSKGEGAEGEITETVAEVRRWLWEAKQEALLVEVDGEALFGSEEAVQGKREYPPEWWEVRVEAVDGCGAGRLIVYDREAARRRYGEELLLVCTVVLVVISSTWTMNRCLWHMAALPIWRMLILVQKFANNPLGRMAFPDKGQHRELVGLHTALMKLGCLLQLAWGVAGAKVIGQSLRGEPQEVATIVHAFFGFCDIRNFTGLTEVLEQEVLHVVNGIAQYVHAAVGASAGFPNKNIGDAFLLVWKPNYQVRVQDTALRALLAYIQIIVELSRSRVLNKWLSSDLIQEALPGYKLELGFGLHHGWAVEGSVGSPMKIDATYISPHVNMASRLEAATKQYGVQILLSGEAHGLLPERVQGLCRRVDRVLVKGSHRPVNLWTYDVPKLKRFGGSLADSVNLTEGGVEPESLLARAPPHTSELFRDRFAHAMRLYLGGVEGSGADWARAEAALEECLLLPGGARDGPTLAILDHIRRTGWTPGAAAPGWRGYRVLVEK